MIVPRRSVAVRMSLLNRSRGLRGLGLGEYCNKYGCFADVAEAARVTEQNLIAEGRVPGMGPNAPAAPASSSVVLPSTSYGSSPNADGGSTYNWADNPLLMSAPSGNTFTGGVQTLSNRNFATREAADSFARTLGGTVVTSPNQIGTWNQTSYAIRLADGTTVDAGAIADILGNAAYGNTNVQSGEIAKLFGGQYQPGIAEALLSGGSVRLAAAPPAPGYLPTPLSSSYRPAAPPSSTVTPGRSVPAGSTSSGSTSSGGSSSGGGATSSGSTSADTGGSGGEGFLGGAFFGGIKNWVLLAGAGAAFLLFSNSGGGRR